MDNPVISQLQKSFSKVCGSVALCLNFKCSLHHPEEETARLWRLLALRLVSCPCLSHILRRPRRRLHLVVHHILALRPREALLDNFLDNLLHSDLLPLSDCCLARRAIRASRRSPPQPPAPRRLWEVRALFLFGGRPLPGQLLVGLEGSGVASWIVETLRVGYWIPFDRRPPLSERPLSLLAYSRQPIKIVALTQKLQTLLRKGAVEPAPQSPDFYISLFLVQKTSGWGTPSLTSHPERRCRLVSFYMETP